jgi:hypothetical protein
MTGLLKYNYFYTQLFSIAVAYWASLAFGLLRNRLLMLSFWIVLMGGIVIPSIHLSIAPWFILYGSLFLFGQIRNLRKAIAWVFCLGITSGMAILFHPSTSGMIAISYNDGGLGMNPLMRPGLIFSSLALMGYIGIGYSYFKEKDFFEFVKKNAGLIAICAVIGLQMAAWAFLKRGSWYAVKKHSYVLAIELSFWIYAGFKDSQWGTRYFGRVSQRAWVGIGAILAFIFQWPFFHYPIDQSVLFQYRDKWISSKVFTAGQFRQPPASPELTPSQRYYLAMGVLGGSLDASLRMFLEESSQSQLKK